MISIVKDILDGASANLNFEYMPTENSSGYFAENLPDTIVLHYTAGASYSSTANWLTKKEAKASSHLVIGRNGEIIQLLPFNQIAWHAGASAWKSRKNLNRYSIGIEIANAGILEKRATGYYTSFGQKIDDENVVFATHKNSNKELAWEAYTPKQLETVEEICRALISQYQITEIVGHDDIAPSRKTDPGPAFPMESFQNKLIIGRQDSTSVQAEKAASKNPKGLVVANRLNIRTSPSLNASLVTEPLKQGTRLQILDFDNDWVKVRVETEGWVSRKYIKHY